MSPNNRFFRFSLPALFIAILFIAFGIAAIRFASPLWADVTFSVTMPILFAAILGAGFRLGQARAFWTGMAVCGWGYLLLVLTPWFETSIGQHLPTTHLLNFAHEKHTEATELAFERDRRIATANGIILADGAVRFWDASTGKPVTAATGPDAGPLLRTGHALFALLFGFLGGVTAKRFYLTRSSASAV